LAGFTGDGGGGPPLPAAFAAWSFFHFNCCIFVRPSGIASLGAARSGGGPLGSGAGLPARSGGGPLGSGADFPGGRGGGPLGGELCFPGGSGGGPAAGKPGKGGGPEAVEDEAGSGGGGAALAFAA
jgi:hypothetical protein